MKRSPFPGMDPYLEELWLEVHASLIANARYQINRQLPDDPVPLRDGEPDVIQKSKGVFQKSGR